MGRRLCQNCVKPEIDKHSRRYINKAEDIIESIDSISRDERGFPLTQYITNGEYLVLGILSHILNTTIVFCG